MPRRKIRVSTARVFARQTAATKIFKLTSAAYIFILTSGRVHANIYNVATGLCCDWVWRSLVACLNGVQEAGGSNPLTQTMRKAPETLSFRGFCYAPVPTLVPTFLFFDMAAEHLVDDVCGALHLPVDRVSVDAKGIHLHGVPDHTLQERLRHVLFHDANEGMA